MLTFLIPTAKEMKMPEQTCQRQLSSKSSAIVQELTNLSANQLAKSYKLKIAAAEKEADRWLALQNGQNLNAPALDLFNGLMYRNIKRAGLSADEKGYLEQHVFITTALYGIIPAYDPIAPHRLDFNMPFKIDGCSLKTYWRQAFNDFISDKDTIVSLLSSEFEEVFSASVRKTFTTVSFLEKKDGKLKKHSTISKKARGKFLTAAMENSVTTLEDLKNLTFDHFSYQPDLSTQKQLVFVKSI